MSETMSAEVVDLSKPPAEGMVRVTFLPEGRTVEFEFDSLPYEGHGEPMSFLDVAENYHIFLDHACGGVCACTTCHLHVKEGAQRHQRAGGPGTGPAGDGGGYRVELAAGVPGGDREAGRRMWSRFRSGTGTTCRKASRRMGREASPRGDPLPPYLGPKVLLLNGLGPNLV